MNLYVLPLSDPQASLEMVGGKGMSLAILVRAGLPVPDGFYITVAAYREFVAASGLQTHILTALDTVDTADPATFEVASQTIARLFGAAQIPAVIESSIRDAYHTLGSVQIAPIYSDFIPLPSGKGGDAAELRSGDGRNGFSKYDLPWKD